MAAHEFSLGHGLFGTSNSSDEEVHDCTGLWRHTLITQHLGAEETLAVFGTSKASCAAVLESAPHATLSMELGGEASAATALHLAHAARALAARGKGLDTRLVLQLAEDAPVTLAAEHLFVPASGQTVTQLSLDGLHTLPASRQQEFLTAASSGLPNLSKLHINTLNNPLPASAFPQLTELHVIVDTEQADHRTVCRSLGPRLPRLTTLTLNALDDIPWSDIFTPTNTSHTLTHFHTNRALSEPLLKLLLKHAPALQQLSVGVLNLQSDHSHDQWGVQTLRLGIMGIYFHIQLMVLPTTSSGQRLVVQLPKKSVYITEQNIADGVLNRVQFQDAKFNFIVDFTPSPNLPSALQQLASTQAGQAPLPVKIMNCPTSPELLQAVAASAGQLPQLSVSVEFQSLNHKLLYCLMQHGAAFSRVSAVSLQLRSNRHSNTVRPWGAFTVHEISNLDSLLCLPRHSAGNRLVDGASYINLDKTPEQVDEFVPKINWSEIGVDSKLRAQLQAPAEAEPATQPAALRANLRLLAAMNLVPTHNDGGSAGWVLNLEGWTVSPAVVQELAGLPPWTGSLFFNFLTWPDEPGVCQQLGRVVPRTYGTWYIPGEVITVEQLLEVCLGVRDSREGLGLKPLGICVQVDPTMVDAVRQELVRHELEGVVHMQFNSECDLPEDGDSEAEAGIPLDEWLQLAAG